MDPIQKNYLSVTESNKMEAQAIFLLPLQLFNCFGKMGMSGRWESLYSYNYLARVAWFMAFLTIVVMACFQCDANCAGFDAHGMPMMPLSLCMWLTNNFCTPSLSSNRLETAFRYMGVGCLPLEYSFSHFCIEYYLWMIAHFIGLSRELICLLTPLHSSKMPCCLTAKKLMISYVKWPLK